eukprot:jgi/Tetstr1/434944/TSEL_023940.t1
MRYHAGDDVTTTVSCLGDRYVAKWKKSNPEGDPAAASLRGTVIGTNVGWVTVAFPDAHPPLSVPARLRPTAPTLTGDRTSPNPVEGKAGGSSTPAPRHEVANKRTLMEAAMSDPADAGEDDPPETAYGPPPDPPKTAWTPVGVQPGERAWSCPRAQSAHKFNVRKTGLMKLGCPPGDVDAIGYFHAFFPMRDMEDAIALMNERATAGEQYFPTLFTTAEFHVFLGVNFAMCKYQTVSQDELWAQPDPQNLMSVDYGFRKHMSLRRFKLGKKYLCMPLNTESGGETIIVKDWLKRINAHWNNNYTPGSVICCDETMFAWVGLCGDLHLTFLPRKPHPIGWMLKSAACVNGMIYIHLELAECKEDMKLKKYVQEHNATTACTLRLVEPWFKSGRIVVADSWFGSVRCALQLSALDMFSVLAVKGGKARYPKEELLAATEEVRFSTCFRTATFPVKKPGDHAGVPPLEVPLLAGAWQDKQCMLVVATCTDHEAADEDIRIRSKYEGGKIVKHRYPISQPNCHAFYRHHFNAIDILNKLSVGPNNVSTVWQTREHMKKFFMCTLAVCETNAYNAYRQFTNRTDMTRAEWKHHLAEELIQYGTARMKKRPASGPSDGSPVTPGDGRAGGRRSVWVGGQVTGGRAGGRRSGRANGQRAAGGEQQVRAAGPCCSPLSGGGFAAGDGRAGGRRSVWVTGGRAGGRAGGAAAGRAGCEQQVTGGRVGGRAAQRAGGRVTGGRVGGAACGRAGGRRAAGGEQQVRAAGPCCSPLSGGGFAAGDGRAGGRRSVWVTGGRAGGRAGGAAAGRAGCEQQVTGGRVGGRAAQRAGGRVTGGRAGGEQQVTSGRAGGAACGRAGGRRAAGDGRAGGRAGVWSGGRRSGQAGG